MWTTSQGKKNKTKYPCYVTCEMHWSELIIETNKSELQRMTQRWKIRNWRQLKLENMESKRSVVNDAIFINFSFYILDN